tara:strand:- start:712 stop:861 length:150 start_codon:yes stop_codon:yes gene_type:complete
MNFLNSLSGKQTTAIKATKPKRKFNINNQKSHNFFSLATAMQNTPVIAN